MKTLLAALLLLVSCAPTTPTPTSPPATATPVVTPIPAPLPKRVPRPRLTPIATASYVEAQCWEKHHYSVSEGHVTWLHDDDGGYEDCVMSKRTANQREV